MNAPTTKGQTTNQPTGFFEFFLYTQVINLVASDNITCQIKLGSDYMHKTRLCRSYQVSILIQVHNFYELDKAV